MLLQIIFTVSNLSNLKTKNFKKKSKIFFFAFIILKIVFKLDLF